MTIHIEPCTLCIRVYEEGKCYKNKDDYIAVMTGLIISDNEVFIQGAHGKLSKKDIIDIHKQLGKMGYVNLTFERHGKKHKSLVSKKLNKKVK